MRYEEYKPPVELASWVKLFWVCESRSNHPAAETVVADGCPELIIHFGSPFSEVDRIGQLLRQPVAVACGQLTRPLVLQSSCDVGMIGIRFHPSGMAPFISESMQSLTDMRLPAGEMFADIDQLADEVQESSNDAQRIAACNRFLLRSIKLDRENISIRRALESIVLERGCISVESLAEFTGTSRRSLELAFQRVVGTSPKMYCRITRFRHIFDAVEESGPSDGWAQVAMDAGFFDQSHLIRDFRRFAGDTPASFLADQTSFASSLNQA